MQLQHAQPVFTSRQVREPAPRNPVPQMNTFDGSAPVSEWWTKFMAYIALHFINEATATNLLPFFLMGIVLQFFTHGLSKTPLTSIRDAFFSRFRPTVPISQTQQRRPQPVSRERDNFRRTNRSRGPGPCFRGGGKSCFDRSKCPANDQFCSYRGVKNHLIKVCHKRFIENSLQFNQNR